MSWPVLHHEAHCQPGRSTCFLLPGQFTVPGLSSPSGRMKRSSPPPPSVAADFLFPSSFNNFFFFKYIFSKYFKADIGIKDGHTPASGTPAIPTP